MPPAKPFLLALDENSMHVMLKMVEYGHQMYLMQEAGHIDPRAVEAMERVINMINGQLEQQQPQLEQKGGFIHEP